MLTIGALSIYTDITQRKIKNIHLLIVSCLAIIANIVFAALKELHFSYILILNPFVALLIGFIFYKANLWKAGDAKLFFTYSLLLPVNRYYHLLPFSCLVLLFNAFLISLLFITPLFLKSIIVNGNKTIKKIISTKTLTYFGKTFLITFGISWIIKPVLSFIPIKENIFLNFILLYIGYSTVYKTMNKTKYRTLMLPVLITGFAIRYVFIPESFSFINMLRYLKYLLGYSLLFYILRNITEVERQKHQRIPFAPFLFIGALLCNTDFLWWVMKTLNYLRR